MKKVPHADPLGKRVGKPCDPTVVRARVCVFVCVFVCVCVCVCVYVCN